MRKAEAVYKTNEVSACRRARGGSSYERSELETWPRICPGTLLKNRLSGFFEINIFLDCNNRYGQQILSIHGYY
jgi:hypothetical protein